MSTAITVWFVSDHRAYLACADPESFARGGPTLTRFFSFFKFRREDPKIHYTRVIFGPDPPEKTPHQQKK